MGCKINRILWVKIRSIPTTKNAIKEIKCINCTITKLKLKIKIHQLHFWGHFLNISCLQRIVGRFLYQRLLSQPEKWPMQKENNKTCSIKKGIIFLMRIIKFTQLNQGITCNSTNILKKSKRMKSTNNKRRRLLPENRMLIKWISSMNPINMIKKNNTLKLKIDTIHDLINNTE